MLVAISVAEDTVQVSFNDLSTELASSTTGCSVAVECTQAQYQTVRYQVLDPYSQLIVDHQSLNVGTMVNAPPCNSFYLFLYF